jgi:hypothetical protein
MIARKGKSPISLPEKKRMNIRYLLDYAITTGETVSLQSVNKSR